MISLNSFLSAALLSFLYWAYVHGTWPSLSTTNEIVFIELTRVQIPKATAQKLIISLPCNGASNTSNLPYTSFDSGGIRLKMSTQGVEFLWVLILKSLNNCKKQIPKKFKSPETYSAKNSLYYRRHRMSH